MSKELNIGFNFKVEEQAVFTPPPPSIWKGFFQIKTQKNTLYTSGGLKVEVSLPAGVKVYVGNTGTQIPTKNNKFTININNKVTSDRIYRLEWEESQGSIPVVVDLVNNSTESIDNLISYDFVERQEQPVLKVLKNFVSKAFVLDKNETVGVVWAGEGLTEIKKVTLNLKAIIRVDNSLSSNWKVGIGGLNVDGKREYILTQLNTRKKIVGTWEGRPSEKKKLFNLLFQYPKAINLNEQKGENPELPYYTYQVEFESNLYSINDTQFALEVYDGKSYDIRLYLKQANTNSRAFYNIPPEKIIKQDNLFRTYTATTTDTLDTFFTGSEQTEKQKRYVIQVYNNESVKKQPVFNVSYGHVKGSGSLVQNTVYPLAGDSETRAIYAQHGRVLENLSESIQRLTDGVGGEIESAYFIDFNKDQIKIALEPGVWELVLDELSGSYVPQNAHTGSNIQKLSGGNKIHLIDDSNLYKSNTQQPYYGIISGSLQNGPYLDSSNNPYVYGKFYPVQGTLVLNGDKLDLSGSFNTVLSNSIYGENAQKLYVSLNSITMRTYDSEKQEIYILNVEPFMYNFSTNPSYVKDYSSRPKTDKTPFTASAVQIRNRDWVLSDGNLKTVDSKTYPTTIGLYDDKYNLLAIGKISIPKKKSREKGMLFHVRLKY